MMAEIRRQLPFGLGAVAAIAVSAGLAGWAAAQSGDPPGSVRAPMDDVGLLGAIGVTDSERADAARRLITSPAAEAHAALERALSGGKETSPARVAVLREVGAMASAPAWLVGPISGLLGQAGLEDADRAGAIAALGSIRTRDSAKVLLEQGKVGKCRSAAMAALARLSGHGEFGEDLNRWQLWYGQMQWLPEAEWRRELAEGLAARADGQAGQRERAVTRLVESLKQQYILIDGVDDRSARLVQFIRDDQAEVRCLGLSLAQQEVANARPLSPIVGDACAGLLADPSAGIRKQAAELFLILAPSSQAPRLAEALRRETDPEVAAVLLKAAGRWAVPELTGEILSWMESGPPAAGPACDALDGIERTGAWSDPVGRGRAAAKLKTWRSADPDSLPATGLRLLFVLGDESDRGWVVSLLKDPLPARRWAAATAVAQVRGGLDGLLDAAHSDAALFPLAAQAVAAFRPTARGFVALAGIPADDAAQRRERLLAMAQSLPHGELLQAAQATADAAMREAMLSRLLREPLASQREPGSSQSLKPAVIAGLLTLCDTRIELGQPAGALVALDALGPAAPTIDPEVLCRRRVVALLWLNRLDEAEKCDAPVGAWLDGLERCMALDQAGNVAEKIEGRFQAELVGDAKERLAALKSRMMPMGMP